MTEQRCQLEMAWSELAELARSDPTKKTLAEQVILLDARGRVDLCGFHAHGHCDASTSCAMAHPAQGGYEIEAVLRGHCQEAQFEYGSRDGNRFYLARVVARAGGGAAITHVDVTGLRRREDRLRVAATMFDEAKELHAIVDGLGTVLLANTAAERSLSRGRSTLRGSHFADLIDDAFLREHGEEISARLRSDGAWSGEVQLRSRDGSALPVWGVVTLTGGGPGKGTRYLVAAHLLDGSRRDAGLGAMALRDPLTGLRNRRSFLDHLRGGILRAERHDLQLGVIILALDGLATIRSTRGREAGDEAMRQIAARLQATLRANDLCTRGTGDELAIAVEDIGGPRDLTLVQQKILRAVTAPLVVGGHALQLAPVLGAASFPMSSTNAEELLATAERAMQCARQHPREREPTTGRC